MHVHLAFLTCVYNAIHFFKPCHVTSSAMHQACWLSNTLHLKVAACFAAHQRLLLSGSLTGQHTGSSRLSACSEAGGTAVVGLIRETATCRLE